MRLAALHDSRYNPHPMKLSNRSFSNKRKDRPALLVLCLIFSILLHLAMVFFLPYEKLTNTDQLAVKPEPTIVRLVDKPTTNTKKEYELDQKPIQPAPEPPPESSRLAEQHQRVEKETAPKGDDVRDQKSKPEMSRPVPPSAKKKSTSIKKQQQAATQNPLTQVKRPVKTSDDPAAQSESDSPTIEQLTQLAPTTLSRILGAEKSAQDRIKQRDDLEEGDTVWLNLERGLLISFFRRFRNQIEGVWNYPREAVEKEMQGILLLKITVDTEGTLTDVELLNSSGYDLLDYEAIQAVYRAAPFGPLGKHYPYPDLKIMAHFRYQISGKYIYGQRR